MTFARSTAVALCVALVEGSAHAQTSASISSRLKALEVQLKAQQETLEEQARLIAAQRAELERLRTDVAASAAPPRQATETAEAVKALDARVHVQELKRQDEPAWSFSAGRPTLTSPDGRFTFTPRAVVQLDAAHYGQGAAGSLARDYRRGSVGANSRETNAARDLSDGALFRRARLGFEGAFNRDFGYRFIAEFGGSASEGPARLNDAWISYTGFAPFSLQIGAFSPPANLDDGTGVEDSLFIERASPAEVSRALGGADGRVGLNLRYATADWFASATLTSRTVNDAEVNDSQAAIVGRIGHLLATGPDYNIHVGVNGTYVIQPADQGRDATGARYGVRLRDRPELRVDSTRLVDTGTLNADGAFAAGVEFGAQYRSFYLQGERFWFGIDRSAPSRDPLFTGFYAQASWVLTGENRRYNPATASFAAPRPFSPVSSRGGWGAWELAVRLSRLNLNDNAGAQGLAVPADGIRGGRQTILGAGLNWFLSTNVRLTFDYLNVDVDRLNPAGPGNLTPFGVGAATPPIGADIGQNFDIWALRSQFAF